MLGITINNFNIVLLFFIMKMIFIEYFLQNERKWAFVGTNAHFYVKIILLLFFNLIERSRICIT